MERINFAFLDGAHSYEDVLFEFNIIEKHQEQGDVIVFDDYNEKLFPGIVKAVDKISEKFEEIFAFSASSLINPATLFSKLEWDWTIYQFFIIYLP